MPTALLAQQDTAAEEEKPTSSAEEAAEEPAAETEAGPAEEEAAPAKEEAAPMEAEPGVGGWVVVGGVFGGRAGLEAEPVLLYFTQRLLAGPRPGFRCHHSRVRAEEPRPGGMGRGVWKGALLCLESSKGEV